MFNPYVIIAAIVFWIASVFAGYTWGHSASTTYWQGRIATERANAVQEALTDYKAKQEKLNALLQKQADDQFAINANLRTQLTKLQNRPSRTLQSAATAANCQGANGSELSREDAGFLIGEAARADTIRDGLSICYAALDVVNPQTKKDE